MRRLTITNRSQLPDSETSRSLSAFDLPHHVLVGTVEQDRIVLGFNYTGGPAPLDDVRWDTDEKRVRIGLAPRGRVERVTVELNDGVTFHDFVTSVRLAAEALDELEDFTTDRLTSYSARCCSAAIRQHGAEIAQSALNGLKS